MPTTNYALQAIRPISMAYYRIGCLAEGAVRIDLEGGPIVFLCQREAENNAHKNRSDAFDDPKPFPMEDRVDLVLWVAKKDGSHLAV